MDRNQAIKEIAATHLGFETLETRNSDALDFHEVACWSLKAALEAAYDAGQASGSQANAEATAERSGE